MSSAITISRSLCLPLRHVGFTSYPPPDHSLPFFRPRLSRDHVSPTLLQVLLTAFSTASSFCSQRALSIGSLCNSASLVSARCYSTGRSLLHLILTHVSNVPLVMLVICSWRGSCAVLCPSGVLSLALGFWGVAPEVSSLNFRLWSSLSVTHTPAVREHLVLPSSRLCVSFATSACCRAMTCHDDCVSDCSRPRLTPLSPRCCCDFVLIHHVTWSKLIARHTACRICSRCIPLLFDLACFLHPSLFIFTHLYFLHFP